MEYKLNLSEGIKCTVCFIIYIKLHPVKKTITVVLCINDLVYNVISNAS